MTQQEAYYLIASVAGICTIGSIIFRGGHALTTQPTWRAFAKDWIIPALFVCAVSVVAWWVIVTFCLVKIPEVYHRNPVPETSTADAAGH